MNEKHKCEANEYAAIARRYATANLELRQRVYDLEVLLGQLPTEETE